MPFRLSIARVRTTQPLPDDSDTAVERMRAEAEALRGLPGCEDALVLASSPGAERARVLTVSLWSTPPAQPPVPNEERDYQIALDVGGGQGTVARVASARLRPGVEESVLAIFQNMVLHAATSEGGFRRGLLLLDPTSHEALSIGLWGTEDDLRRSARSGYLQAQLRQFADLVATPPRLEELRVIRQG